MTYPKKNQLKIILISQQRRNQMKICLWVLVAQLWEQQAALSSCEGQKNNTSVILIESLNYAKQRPYHRQKLILIWSAIRHFSEELRLKGWNVTYTIAEDYKASLTAWAKKYSITELQVMTTNDRPFAQMIGNLGLSCQITFVSNNLLMVLNNFALIAGISPQEVEKYFQAVFIDAYNWVMQTNVIVMIQFVYQVILAYCLISHQ
jgi:deoxyribodipyrimidine photolyase-like uncharacterized protein